MIREAAKKGPNFAGHYAIAEWGCGTGCIQMAVVDLESGDVDLGPFETLCLGATREADKAGVFYRLNSSLLIVTGCPNEKNCGTYYYALVGQQFKLLRKDASKSELGCAP